MPKVSVIVPIYNVEAYLPMCVDSLRNQTLEDIEIILVDDGSPDGCAELIDGYAREDRRIKVIHKKNAGVSAARNDGFALAEAPYAFFADSDDWLSLDALESLYARAVATRADVVLSDYLSSDGQNETRYTVCSAEFTTSCRASIDALQLAVFNMGPARYPAKEFVALRGIGAAWHHLISTKLIRENGCEFNTSLGGLFDDGLFVLNVLEHAQTVSYVQHPTYYYRTVAESITRAFKASPFPRYQRVYEALQAFIEHNQKSPEFGQALCLRKYIYLNKAMRTYFMHPKNPASDAKRFAEFISTVKGEPYASAIRGFDAKQLGCVRSEILVFLLRVRLYRAFWLLKKASS